jgi:hypothetical protein
MKQDNQVKSIFNRGFQIPPMFSDNFRQTGPEWNRITKIDFEASGRILMCHLIVEHYMTNLIKLLSPEDFNWAESRMTFSQKFKLISKIEAFNEFNFIKGIESLNKIRNKFSHNLLATISETDIKVFRTFVDRFYKKSKSKKFSEYFDKIAIIELYTLVVCSYFAGYCTSIVDLDKIKKKEHNIDYQNELSLPT